MNAILGLLLAFQVTAFATPIHFDEVILTKDTSTDFSTHANRTKDEYVQCLNHGVVFESYQAAVDYDALQDGLYDCQGQFVMVPGQGHVQIFALTHCQALSGLKQNCEFGGGK
jgi:hypothetical protein